MATALKIRNQKSEIRNPDNYWFASKLPLQALFFLAPLIVLYELGTLLYATDYQTGVTHAILAQELLRRFFHWFGVGGGFLPGLIVVAVLLTWHLFARDPWKFEPRTYGMMWVESLLLALPMFVFMLILVRHPLPTGGGAAAIDPHAPALQVLSQVGSLRMGSEGGGVSWQANLVFSIGAGIYEELLFRLIAIAVVHMVLVDVLAMPPRAGAVCAVVFSAVAFALYHFNGANPFRLDKFIFYSGAGLYLAAVYLLRGFGIVAGTHALYDVLVVCLQLTQR